MHILCSSTMDFDLMLEEQKGEYLYNQSKQWEWYYARYKIILTIFSVNIHSDLYSHTVIVYSSDSNIVCGSM